MSWTNAPVFGTSNARPMISARLRQNKYGKTKLVLYISPFLLSDLGEPATLQVQIGGDEHAGCLRLSPDGEHKLGGGPRGLKTLTLPHFDGLPDAIADTEPCALVETGGGVVVLRLPLDAWQSAIDSRKRQALTVTARTPALPAPERKVDMALYLQSHGKKAMKLANGWTLEGERVNADEVLELVNSFRRREGLKAISLADAA